jgi:hypothetical protein
MMARFNQLAGLTPQQWAERYARRRARLEEAATILGGTIEASAIGGPGVPGHAKNFLQVRLPDGTLLGRKQALRQAGLPLGHDSPDNESR